MIVECFREAFAFLRGSRSDSDSEKTYKLHIAKDFYTANDHKRLPESASYYRGLDFAVSLCKATCALTNGKRDNVLVSPVCAEAALCTMYLATVDDGAREQIAAVLGLNEIAQVEDVVNGVAVTLQDLSTLHDRLLEASPQEDQDQVNIIELKYVNAIFITEPAEPERAIKLDEEVGNLALLYRKLDLVIRNCESTSAINKFVMDMTSSKLPDFVSQEHGKIDAGTVVLVNAMHLKAEFVLSLIGGVYGIENDLFTLDDGSAMKADMMTGRFPTGYGVVEELGGAEMVRLDYAEGECRLFVLLPNRKGDMNTVAKVLLKLTGKILQSAVAFLTDRDVSMQIPTVWMHQSYDLMPVFRSMGLTSTPEIHIPDALQIRHAFQKTSIGIVETGTEDMLPGPGRPAYELKGKSLSVNITLKPASLTGWGDRNPIIICVDHPFCMFIQHLETGAILYAGVICKPQSKLETRN